MKGGATMNSLYSSLDLAIKIAAFCALIIIPLGIVYTIIAIPYWLWEGFQLQYGRVTEEYLDNRPIGRFLFAPFKFYFSKLFGLTYKL